MPGRIQKQQPQKVNAEIASRLEAELQSKLVTTMLAQASTAITAQNIEQGEAKVDVQGVHVESVAGDMFAGGKQSITSTVEIDGELRVPFNVRISVENLTELLMQSALTADGVLTKPKGDA